MLNLQATNTIQGIAGTGSAITYSIFGMQLASGIETYQLLAQGQLANSVGIIYTVPASTTSFVKTIILVNTTALSVIGINLYVNGSTAAFSILPGITIPAYGTLVFNQDGYHVYDVNGNLYTSGTNIFDTVAANSDTPGAASTNGSVNIASRRDHTHQSPGGIASIISTSAGINTTETPIVNFTIPANFLKAGTTFRLRASGVCTSTVANASNFRCRIGTTGTSSDGVAAVVTPTAAASGTAIPFDVDMLVTIRSIGSGTSGSALGVAVLRNNGTTGVSAAALVIGQVTTAITFDTTGQLIIQLSYVSAATTTTCTFYNAEIEIVKM